MKQKLIGSLLLTTALFACSDDKKNDIVTPEETKLSFKSILCNDAQLEESLSVNATTKLKFKAELSSNEEDYSIAWILNGDTLAKGLEQSYDLEGRSGTFKAVLISNQTQVDEKTVELVGPYKNGSFIYNKTSLEDIPEGGKLAFISEIPELVLPKLENSNLFIEANPDQTNATFRSVISVNNKLYIVQSANIEIADAQTLKSIQSVKNVQAEEVALINSKHLLVRTARGILTVNLSNGEETNTIALQAEANPTQMAVLKDYTAIAAENNILFIAHGKLEEHAKISFGDNNFVSNIMTGNDGYLYAFVKGENPNVTEEHQASFVKIDPIKLEIIQTTSIEAEYLAEENDIENLFVAKSLEKDIFYFAEASEDKGLINLYSMKYNGEYSLLTSIVDDFDYFQLAGYMSISNHLLYIPIQDGSGNNSMTKVFNLESNEYLNYDYQTFIYTTKANMVSK